MQPRALVVEDADEHRYIARTILEQMGFCVVCVRSLTHCIEQATTMLDPAQPPVPTLILLDLMLPHERCPILEGTTGAAWLIEQMELGYLHPAHIVAISSELTEERHTAIQAAGCQLALKKPLTANQGILLRTLVEQSPILPRVADTCLPSVEADKRRVARRVLRHIAAELIHFLRSEPAYSQEQPDSVTPLWHTADVRLFLNHPTHLLRAEPWRSWIYGYGGIQQLRRRIQEHIQNKWHAKEKRRQAIEAYLAHGDCGYQHADQLNMSRATFYRRLEEAFEELAVDMNEWRS